MGASEASLNPDIIDWESDASYALLNPRWANTDLRALFEVARSHTPLKGHLWLATSGSTAESMSQVKLVALSKQAFLVSAQSVNRHLQAGAEDVWLQVLPRFHVGGLGVEVRAALSGGRLVRDFEKWHPDRVQALLEKERVSLASFVPTQVFDLVQKGLRAPKALRAVVVGGGALTESLYRQARALGWPLLPSYGLTETCSQIATAPLSSLEGDSMPLAQRLSHAEWSLSPESLLKVRGPSLLTCYGRRSAEGAVKFWDPKQDGWLTTEDFVILSQDGIRFVGRKNDVIKIGGEGSSLGRLREILERVVQTLQPELQSQIALLDAPSARLGSEIHLVSALWVDTHVVSQVMEAFNRDVLPFERIREVKYTTEIPRSDLGKILWARLKKDLYEH